MTRALLCDGCGRLASDSDPTNSDPALRWWSLLRGPVPGGIVQALSVNLDDLDDSLAPQAATDEDEPEPERHFCSDGCLRGWLEGRA